MYGEAKTTLYHTGGAKTKPNRENAFGRPKMRGINVVKKDVYRIGQFGDG